MSCSKEVHTPFLSKKNHSMLDRLRENTSLKSKRLLGNKNGYINKTRQSIGHIYATILEIGFGDNWGDFMKLNDFIKEYNNISLSIRQSQHTDVTIDSYLLLEHVWFIILILKEWDEMSSEKIKDISLSIFEGVNYRKIPSKIAIEFNNLKDD